MNLKEQLLSMDIDSKIRLIDEINSYNGTLEFLWVWENENEFFQTFFFKNPYEAVRAVCHGNYNYYEPYVRFDGYGNLESLTEDEFEADFKDYIDEIVEALKECNIDLNYYGIEKEKEEEKL